MRLSETERRTLIFSNRLVFQALGKVEKNYYIVKCTSFLALFSESTRSTRKYSKIRVLGVVLVLVLEYFRSRVLWNLYLSCSFWRTTKVRASYMNVFLIVMHKKHTIIKIHKYSTDGRISFFCAYALSLRQGDFFLYTLR